MNLCFQQQEEQYLSYSLTSQTMRPYKQEIIIFEFSFNLIAFQTQENTVFVI